MLSKMVEETVDGLVLRLVLMSPPFSVRHKHKHKHKKNERVRSSCTYALCRRCEHPFLLNAHTNSIGLFVCFSIVVVVVFFVPCFFSFLPGLLVYFFIANL